MPSADFASFIRSIERRLIGYLLFTTLDDARAEELFTEVCGGLRSRFSSRDDAERALFEAARAALRGAAAATPTNASPDELRRELARMDFNAREALCFATFGPQQRESPLGRRMIKAAPAPSLQRQMRALRSTAKSLVIVGISLCLCLALVAAFAALHTGSIQEPESDNAPPDWLEDRIKEARSVETDTTWGKGALVRPADGEAEALAGVNVDFDLIVPEKLPQGFRLSSAKVLGPSATGLEFTVVQLNYANGPARLVIIEAEGGFPWRSEFNAKSGRHARSIQRYGTAALVISNAFMEDALDEIAANLKPR